MSETEYTEPCHLDLLEIDPLKAIAEKSRRGRERHGEEWVGHRPIVEAHEEALDLGAYLFFELEKSEIDQQLLEELVRQTLNVIQGVRVAIKSVGGKT